MVGMDMKKKNLKEKKRTSKNRKQYSKPKIVHEFDLETRAGTVIPPSVDFDPLTGMKP
jgi:hypothetical protein